MSQDVQSESIEELTSNLKLPEKGINIGFLNVQGIFKRDMTKFAEIQLMMTSKENKNFHFFQFM